MKVFVTGASGLVGRALTKSLVARGDTVIALTRQPRESVNGVDWIVADPTQVSAWGEAVDGCDGIVNLAGEPIAQRWTSRAMTSIVRSRVGVTTGLHHALAAAAAPPRVLVSASAVGYYGTSVDETFDESSPQGGGFLARVCEQWEEAASRSASLTRLVILRFGIVLSPVGGALPKLMLPFKMGMGGNLGSGQQWMSWIHLHDLVRLILFALDSPTADGVVNATAPTPVRNHEFSRSLGAQMGRPNWLGAGKFWLGLGLGKMAKETIVEGQRVLPTRAEALGFDFQFPELQPALSDL
ncbi:MAG: TIGR01777 family oxidoreductase, partial [Myxococcota bacterium]